MAAVVLMPLKLKPTRYNGDFMTLNKLSNADLNAIVLAAEEVISALAGENDEVHRDNSSKMCAIWDDLNDRYAPPEVVKAMASELLAYREASREHVADVVAWNKPGEERTCDIRWRRFDVAPGPLYTAPQPLETTPNEYAVQQLATELSRCIDTLTGERHSAATVCEIRKSIVDVCRPAMLKSVINEPHQREIEMRGQNLSIKLNMAARLSHLEKLLHGTEESLIAAVDQIAELESRPLCVKLPDEISLETATIIAWGLGCAGDPGKIFKAGYDRCRDEISKQQNQ